MKSLVLGLLTVFIFAVNAEDTKIKSIKAIKTSGFIQEMKITDFHNYHVKEFAKADGFAMERTISMPKVQHVVIDGKKYQMTNMKLLSVTDRKKPVMWEIPEVNALTFMVMDSIDRSMLKNKDMKKRPLTEKELMSMNKLKQGVKRVLAKKNGALELMAPLHAGPSCTRCHEDYKKNEFMGAFLYTLGEVGTGLKKNVDKPIPEKKEKVQELIKEVSSK